eukprot:6436885-Prymnesium_polylepis.1
MGHCAILRVRWYQKFPQKFPRCRAALSLFTSHQQFTVGRALSGRAAKFPAAWWPLPSRGRPPP